MGYVVLVGTGGTIASVHTPAGIEARISTEELLAATIRRYGDLRFPVKVREFTKITSYKLTVQQIWDLIVILRSLSQEPGVDGIVVTHGTDTMEESAYAAELTMETDKPVIFTGAQLPFDDPQSDGLRNLYHALLAAHSPGFRGGGVVVCFNGELHEARYVTKTHTSSLSAFQSPGRGPVAIMDVDGLHLHGRPVRRGRIHTDKLAEDVELVVMTAGMTDRQLLACRNACGVVIETFGRGNPAGGTLNALHALLKQGIPVLVTSRCGSGRVLPLYGNGGGWDLQQAGAMFAGDLTGIKARILLMAALGTGVQGEELAELIHSMAG